LGAEGNRCHCSLQVKALGKLMDSLQKQSLSLAMRMDNLATQLALRIATKVIMREMENPQNMKSRIAHALAQIPLNERLTIRLNPADHEILEQARGAQLDGPQVLPADVILIADSSIQRGGCIVEGAAGTLDARIETQFKIIEQALGGDRLAEK
jgi:flagellar biosynthesis/type III secretory pathway protein FliH